MKVPVPCVHIGRAAPAAVAQGDRVAGLVHREAEPGGGAGDRDEAVALIVGDHLPGALGTGGPGRGRENVPGAVHGIADRDPRAGKPGDDRIGGVQRRLVDGDRCGPSRGADRERRRRAGRRPRRAGRAARARGAAPLRRCARLRRGSVVPQQREGARRAADGQHDQRQRQGQRAGAAAPGARWHRRAAALTVRRQAGQHIGVSVAPRFGQASRRLHRLGPGRAARRAERRQRQVHRPRAGHAARRADRHRQVHRRGAGGVHLAHVIAGDQRRVTGGREHRRRHHPAPAHPAPAHRPGTGPIRHRPIRRRPIRHRHVRYRHDGRGLERAGLRWARVRRAGRPGSGRFGQLGRPGADGLREWRPRPSRVRLVAQDEVGEGTAAVVQHGGVLAAAGVSLRGSQQFPARFAELSARAAAMPLPAARPDVVSAGLAELRPCGDGMAMQTTRHR